MDTHDLFFFLPSTIFTILAFSFLLLWRLKLSSSWQWAAGFAQTAAGFALSSFPIEPTFDQFVSGLLYTSAAYCYGSAILIHFSSDLMQRVRRAIALGFIGPHIYLVLVQPSLRLDLFLIEMVFALLTGLVVLKARKLTSTTADQFLLFATVLVVVDCLVRGIVFTFIYPTSEQMGDFVQSAYNISAHVTTITLCLIFPFAAIAAMATVALDQHKHAAARDPLTNLLNRRGFQQAVMDASTGGRTLGSIILLDIDHFKKINDNLGHAAGDKVIVQIARRLESLTDERVVVGRFGGEEFVIFLNGADEGEAMQWAEIARQHIRLGWHDQGFKVAVTASFGISEVEQSKEALELAIRHADKALYRAKLEGRDRIACASSSARSETGVAATA